MDEHHRASTCRWARPTLSLPYPVWLDAETRPWTCLRPSGHGPLETTEICEACPNRESKRLVSQSG